MIDKKQIDAAVSKIAARGGAATQNFGQRMAAARKTPRGPSIPSRASSTAAPSVTTANKGDRPTKVKQPATSIPAPAKAKAAKGMGKARGGHASGSIVHNHYYGASDNDGDE